MVARDDGTVQVSDDLEAVRQALFAELDRDRAPDVHRRLMLASAASMATPSTYRGHPTTYVICEHDQATPPAAQEAMAAKATTSSG
ncbi:MAG: alpha/beta hydrolase, partial [Actinobacteria bacterium]|nr:alpha/beta hydrolase [Actinomycetota bacterium]